MNKGQMLQLLKAEVETRNKLFPFKNFRLNRGQLKALSCWDNPDARTGEYVKFNIITGGNGSGKTTLIAGEVLPALCYGIGAIHPSRQNCGLYNLLLARKKKKGTLCIRIVAPSKSISRGGSLYNTINQWIPQAQWSDCRDFYHTLTINGQEIQLLSNNQTVEQHSGSNCDLIIIDEPLSNELWAENVGRLRNGGFLLNTVTPLKGCDYLTDIAERPEEYGSTAFTKISIWDNCKDIEGTNGVLSRSDIEAQISMWKNFPEELPARVDGDLMKLAGNVFGEFDPNVHIIEDLPSNSYIYGYVIDPHLVKEPCVLFYAQDPQDNIYIYDEYPRREWHLIKHTTKTIADFCEDIKQIIGDKPQAYTLGDPNFMNVKLPNVSYTMAQEYKKCGVAVNTKVNDSHYIGIGTIHKLLHFDKEKPISVDNHPRLYFLRKCRNTISAMRKYRYTDKSDTDKANASGIVETAYKCFIDCLRYAACSVKDFNSAQARQMEARTGIPRKQMSKSPSVGTINLW